MEEEVLFKVKKEAVPAISWAGDAIWGDTETRVPQGSKLSDFLAAELVALRLEEEDCSGSWWEDATAQNVGGEAGDP